MSREGELLLSLKLRLRKTCIHFNLCRAMVDHWNFFSTFLYTSAICFFDVSFQLVNIFCSRHGSFFWVGVLAPLCLVCRSFPLATALRLSKGFGLRVPHEDLMATRGIPGVCDRKTKVHVYLKGILRWRCLQKPSIIGYDSMTRPGPYQPYCR